MKLTYFHYYLAPHDEPEARVACDVSELLRRFCAFNHSEFKNSFQYSDGEFVFLFWVSESIYMFIITKNNEIIKTINSESVNFGDVYEKLHKNESLGFASYLYLEPGFYGLAATSQGPKNTVLLWFFNQLLERLRITNYKFVAAAFETKSTRAEATTMTVVGQNIIEVGPENSLRDQVLGLFGVQNTHEVGDLAITIKPSGSNMRETSQVIAKNIEDDGIKKYIVKAKASLDDALSDYYIVGQGVLSDPIDRRNEKTIYDQIRRKVLENKELEHRLKLLSKDSTYVTRKIQTLDDYRDASAWSRYIPDNRDGGEQASGSK